MRLPSSPRVVPTRWGLVLLAAAAVVSCSDVTATSRELALEANLNELGGEHDVIIRDIVYPDPTVDQGPYAEITEWEPEPGGLTPTFSVAAASLPREPTVRVGVVYSELAATTVRIGGRDNYEIRAGSRTGSVLASGLTGGEVVATRVPNDGGTPSIRLTLPGGGVITRTEPVVLISASGFVRVRRSTADASVYRGTAEVRFNATPREPDQPPRAGGR